ncbi:DUF2314 domain-containing protein [Pseudoalteromonas luteoviolacea]|uniref:DUF2314 domain-containing protein n=1 Tax=Pseudoalteromonas luteoviolacea NCIMB 1942 TaxID=1365253 RepID=A0A167AKA5_9GAMM|nr:DUF2314 domain-containing protein [Pseudoalteromonas luteoviolacea]KZN45494.1 hypothetical protein N482_14750 [Pseudoalteromonas luteoviolacea NCIMB 1942]KZX02124.1 hypothetical protein JL49_01895 [Pseudoalteromonas luteoviolacea]
MYWGLLIVAVLLGLWLHYRYSSSSEMFPPLETDPDDPLLLEAVELAKESIDEFKTLFLKYPKDAFVKLGFESDHGVVEHLGAHVETIKGDEVSVFLVTPPITHSKKMAHNFVCQLDDIEDWQITDDMGNIYGGFIQRAMFTIAQRDGIDLPPELNAMKEKYLDL